MLSRVPPESNVHGVLQVRDILLELDGVRIGNDGTSASPSIEAQTTSTEAQTSWRHAAAMARSLRLAAPKRAVARSLAR